MTKPVLLGKTGALVPQMPAGRTQKSDITNPGVPLGPDHAFTMEMNQTSGLADLGVIRLWKVLAADPWVSEVSSATVYPHGENPLGGSPSFTFLNAVAVDDTRAVVYWKFGIHSNNGTTNWRHYAAVVSRSGDTVSVGTQIEVLTPTSANAVGATWIGYTFDRWDGTTEGAYNWEPSHTINGLVELTADGFVAFTTLTHTNTSTFEQDRSVLVARRFTISGTTIASVAGDAGKWVHVFSTANSPRTLWARDVARLPSGQYVVAVGAYPQIDVYLVIIDGSLPDYNSALAASSVLLVGATAENGRDRVVRVAPTPDGKVSVVTSREDLVPKRLNFHLLTVTADGGSTRDSIQYSTDLYSWGYWESSDTANLTNGTGQLVVWSINAGLVVASIGLAAQGGLEESVAEPHGLFSVDYWNSHFIVMPDRARAIMRLTDFYGEQHQYFLYTIGAAPLPPPPEPEIVVQAPHTIIQRKPPSQRDQNYALHRNNRIIQSMAPGTRLGRVANAAPLRARPTAPKAVSKTASTTAPLQLGSPGPLTTSGGATEPGQFMRDRFPTNGLLAADTTTLKLSYQPEAMSLRVFLNGIELDEGNEYTVSSGTLTFTPTLRSGDWIDARYTHAGVPVT